MEYETSVLSLNDIHQITLELLDSLDKICEKLKISYYLAYGTLLGCIRHQGFIPWDDDADIWMTREDYNKFIQHFENNNYMLGHIKLCNRRSTQYYDYPIIRISDMRYKYLAADKKNMNTPDMGVFIDIYPLERFKNKKQFDIAYSKISKLNRQYAIYCHPDVGHPLKKALKYFYRTVCSLRYGRDICNKIEKKTDDYISQYTCTDGNYYGVPCWYTTNNRLLKTDYFKEANKHNFEGFQFKIPLQYHLILTEIYGDYMTPPPEDKRVQYHNYQIVRRDHQ